MLQEAGREPVPLPDGQHPGTGVLGHEGPGPRHPEGQAAASRPPSGASPSTTRCSGRRCP
ncbi:MAG: hypothetical protein MZV70_15815 [Desulfobacterales bacterium]|nr:hypothetical protein [Desulfobacterales bacterium]